MSAPLRAVSWLIIGSTHRSECIKHWQAGGIKLHGETQTAKLPGKGTFGFNSQNLEYGPELSCTTFRITNLITRIVHHNRICAKWGPRTHALTPLILSLVLGSHLQVNGTAHRGKSTYARNLVQTTATVNYGITYGNSWIPKNGGVIPKGPKLGGDGVAIVVCNNIQRATAANWQVRTISSKAGQKLAMRGSEDIKLPNVVDLNIKAISNLKNLVTAYELIKSNPGNMTRGADDVTLDGLNLAYLKNIQAKLRSGTFEFNPARRIQIPKAGKKETRPLTIASPREKIVQKAILLVLERYYENLFLDSSHGFRTKRGTHTAIKDLEAKFQSIHYVVEADFSKAFDSIQHETLMNLLKRDIKCEKTISLINSGLKAGYIEFGNLHDNLSMGTPQGSILSPLLCNIFLHELDKFVEELKKNYNRGTKRQRNLENTKLQNKLKHWRKRNYDKTRPSEYETLLKQLKASPSIKRDETYIRINYIRYADDFVIGVEGSYTLTNEILNKVSLFVEEKLNLKFNPDKTGITCYAYKPFKFLGFIIRAPHFKGITKPLERIKIKDKIITRRKKLRISIHMDTEKVLKKLQANGFIAKRTSHAHHKKLEVRGTFKGNLINIDHADILKYYNSVVRGLLNYYSFAKNRQDLARIGWLIKESCALTLARKFKLKSLAKTFQKFGSNLSFKTGNKTVDFEDVSYKKAVNIASIRPIVKDPLQALETVWNSKFTKSKLLQKCVICDSDNGVEMHHVSKIRDLKNPNHKLDFFTRQMAAINRKQIPLCKDHHIGLHNNTWTNEEKEKFKYEAKGVGRKRFKEL
jgi:group II intron reverse transcriptase/maturase